MHASAMTRLGAVLVALVGALLLLPSFSHAEMEPEGWTPAMRVGFGFLVQGLDGQAFVNDALPAIQNDPELTPLGSPGDSIQSPAFRLGFRLYTPEDLLGTGKYTPRLFVQAGMERPLDSGFIATRYASDFDAVFSGGGMADVSMFCPEAPPVTTCNYAATTTVDVLFNWNLSVGADFRLPIMEGQYHLVPTIGYYGQATESEGEFTVVLSAPMGIQVGTDDPRTIESQGGTDIVHGITAGLSFEIDVLDGENISAKVFLETAASWLLTDRDSKFSGTEPMGTVNFGNADFLVRQSKFGIISGGGVELRWRGL